MLATILVKQIHSIDIFAGSMLGSKILSPQNPTKFGLLCLNKEEKIDRTFSQMLSGEKLYIIQENVTELQFKIDCSKKYNSDNISQIKYLIDNGYKYTFTADAVPGIYRYNNYNSHFGIPVGETINNKYYVINHLTLNIFNTPKSKDDPVRFDLIYDNNSFVELIENSTINFQITGKLQQLEGKDNKACASEYSKISSIIGLVTTLLIAFILLWYSGRIYYLVKTQDSKDSGFDLDFDSSTSYADLGWRLLHGDVFRSPAKRVRLSSFVGIGLHLLTSLLITFGSYAFHIYRIDSFSTFSELFILCYFFSAPICGYTASHIFKTIGSSHWKRNLLFSGGFTGCVLSGIYLIAQLYLGGKSSSAYNGILFIIKNSTIIFGGSFVFHAVGSIFALKGMPIEYPSMVNQLPRHIPQQPWYVSTPIVTILGGIVVASGISSDLLSVLESLWMLRPICSRVSLFVAVLKATILSSAVSIAVVLYILRLEDYNWWWRAFLAPAGIGITIILFSICTALMIVGTNFGSLLPYLLTSVAIAFVVSMACGSVGFLSAFFFVLKLYDTLKVE